MSKLFYLIYITISMCAGIILFSCCSKLSDEVAINKTNTLTVDIGSEPPTLDPALVEDAYSYRVVNDLFSGLVDWDQTNNPIHGLAVRWDISPDGKTYIFHLRDNLKFSDGSPIFASDFVYSWQRLVDPKTASPYNFLLKNLLNAEMIIANKLPATELGVSAPNNLTFVVKLVHPDNAFLSKITLANTFVVSQHVIEKYANNWTKPQNMVSSGAYKLYEHVVNGNILVGKNYYFYAESNVAIQYVKYFPYSNVSASLANFKTGTLDTTWNNIPIDDYLTLKQQYSKELHTIRLENLHYINFNMILPKYLNNLKLRQALSMAIDRVTLVNSILRSGEVPSYTIISTTIDNDKYKNIKYTWSKLSNTQRVALAKELYKEAGYNTEHPVILILKYRSNDLDKKIALSIASMWSSILSAQVTVQNEEWSTFIRSLHSGDYDLALGGWGADYNSVTTYSPLYMCNNPNNYGHYCNTRYDQMIDQADKISNQVKREQLYQQALLVALDDYPIIPLREPNHQRLVNSRVHNYLIDKNYLDHVQSKWFYLQ